MEEREGDGKERRGKEGRWADRGENEKRKN